MPRDVSGNYTLPAGNPVISGTTIDTTWANPTLNDVGAEMTDSLSRSGEGGMLAQFKSVSGTMGAPGICFLNQLNLGLYRDSASDMRVTVNGVDRMRWVTGNPQIWDVAAGAFSDIVYALSKPAFQGENPTIVDTTTAALITTDGDPNSNTHIEYGFNTIQVKGDATSFDKMFLQRLAGDLSVGAVAATGSTIVTFMSNGLPMMISAANLTTLKRDDDLAATDLLTVWESADGTSLGQIGVSGTDNFEIFSRINGADLVIACESAGGAETFCGRFNANTKASGMGGLSLEAIRSDTISLVPTLAGQGHFFQAGITTATNLAIGQTTLQGRNNGIAANLNLNPLGGEIKLGAAFTSSKVTAFNGMEVLAGGVTQFKTEVAASGGLTVFQSVTATGIERVLTESDRTSQDVLLTSNVTLVASQASKWFRKADSTARTITLNTGVFDTAALRYTEITFDNVEGTTGDITISLGGGIALRKHVVVAPGEIFVIKQQTLDNWVMVGG